MATNKEKYIDNASNEELAKILAKSLDRCSFCCLKPEICDGCISQCEKRIAYWLSQEVEEDYVYIPNIGKIPKTDKTKTPLSMDDIKHLLENNRDYCLLVKEIVELQERVKELEKCSKCQNKFRNATQEEKDCVYDYMLKTSKKNGANIRDYDKTADEMFAELCYEKDKYSYITFLENEWGVKRIVAYNHLYKRDTIAIYEDDKYYKNTPITLAEDRAIHKKIEELKN